jgi:hypothetical protein
VNQIRSIRSVDLLEIATDCENVREKLKSINSSDADVPRLLAIARTHLETAQLYIEKASDRIP